MIVEAEASGDNDEADAGLHGKSLRTTVEQLKRRLSQAEKEIVVLKRYQIPQKCQSHEKCEILRQDLLTWRDNYEKRLYSQIIAWQTAEKTRIYDEMQDTRKVYGNIQRHLEALERRNIKSYFDFRKQIDLREKRLRDNVVRLHESNLMELREQLAACFKMYSATNISNVKNTKCKEYKSYDDLLMKRQDRSSDQLSESEMTTLYEDNIKFLHSIEHIIKFIAQRQYDDLVKRIDQQIKEVWSAFEDFKHNFCLDHNYRRHNYVEVNNEEVDAIVTEDLNDFTCKKL